MNKNYGIWGAGVQSERGTAATAPATSFHASSDSNGIDAERSLETLALTIGGRSTAVESYINETNCQAEVTTIGFAEVIAQMLAFAMGADAATAVEGKDGEYLHDITGGESIPYFTFYEQKGSKSAALRRLVDAKVNEIQMTAEGVAPMAFQFSLVGSKAEWLALTEWNGPAFNITDGYYRLSDAVFLFSLNDSEPVAVPASVVLNQFNLTISNNVEAQRALGKIEPQDQQEASSVITAELQGTTDSTDLYRTVQTGSPTGTAVASVVVTGSLQVTFRHSVHGDWAFVVKMPAIPWNCEVPAASTDGGPFDLRLSTDGALDLGSGAAEFLINDKAASHLSAATSDTEGE